MTQAAARPPWAARSRGLLAVIGFPVSPAAVPADHTPRRAGPGPGHQASLWAGADVSGSMAIPEHVIWSWRWSPRSGSPTPCCPGSARPAAAPARTGKQAAPGPGGPYGSPSRPSRWRSPAPSDFRIAACFTFRHQDRGTLLPLRPVLLSITSMMLGARVDDDLQPGDPDAPLARRLIESPQRRGRRLITRRSGSAPGSMLPITLCAAWR